MLKKMTLAYLLAIGCLAFQTSAQTSPAAPEQAKNQVKNSKETASAEPRKVDESAPVQIGFWFDVPGNTERVRVNGFRFGFPFSGTSHVSGLDLSLFGSDCAGINGAQISMGFCNSSVRSHGLQASVFTCLSKVESDGAQVSLFNKADKSKGWQVGGTNLSDSANGAQVSLVNIVGQLKGFQAGIVNVVTRSIGPQIGLVNYAERSSFQLGLININEKSSMPFMVFFNFSK
ncbi:MAG: hypothetical protein WCV67_11435 [Victivallaceae bacterium]|jgi:hypothetical protein